MKSAKCEYTKCAAVADFQALTDFSCTNSLDMRGRVNMTINSIKVNNEQIISVDEYPSSNSSNLVKSSGINETLRLKTGGGEHEIIQEIEFDGGHAFINEYYEIQNTADTKMTDYIEVSENDTFYYRGQLNHLGLCVVGCDINKRIFCTLLTYGDYTSNTQIVIPDNVYYIIASSAFLDGWTPGYLAKVTIEYTDEYTNNEVYNEIQDQFDDIDSQIDNINEILSNNNVLNLKNKKVLFFGDSITMTGNYLTEFQRLTECITYNRGQGGTGFTYVSNDKAWPASLCKRVDLPANEQTAQTAQGLPSSVDLIYVFAGVNDWGRTEKDNETPPNQDGMEPAKYIMDNHFGDIYVEDINTFCGAVRYTFRRLKEKYPRIPIIAILPLHTYPITAYPLWSEIRYATQNDESTVITPRRTTLDNKTFYDYRNAIRDIAELYGIYSIDTFKIGYSAVLSTDKSAYYGEGLHPNALGYKLLGQFIYKQTIDIFINRA